MDSPIAQAGASVTIDPVAHVQRLKFVLAGLASVELRISWLTERLNTWPDEHAATLLDELAQQCENADPSAHEAMTAVALTLAGAGDQPWRTRLANRAARVGLLGLERLLRELPPPRYRQHADDLPVPNYRGGRELTLGERRALARRPDRTQFDALLSDPHPWVIHLLLANPKLTEEDVVRFTAQRPSALEALRELSRSVKWLCRPRVRLTLILNPAAPSDVSVPLLALCPRPELRQVIESTPLPVGLRALAREHYERRPPMPPMDLEQALRQ